MHMQSNEAATIQQCNKEAGSQADDMTIPCRTITHFCYHILWTAVHTATSRKRCRGSVRCSPPEVVHVSASIVLVVWPSVAPGKRLILTVLFWLRIEL